jgi:hypothetical protein
MDRVKTRWLALPLGRDNLGEPGRGVWFPVARRAHEHQSVADETVASRRPVIAEQAIRSSLHPSVDLPVSPLV